MFEMSLSEMESLEDKYRRYSLSDRVCDDLCQSIHTIHICRRESQILFKQFLRNIQQKDKVLIMRIQLAFKGPVSYSSSTNSSPVLTANKYLSLEDKFPKNEGFNGRKSILM